MTLICACFPPRFFLVSRAGFGSSLPVDAHVSSDKLWQGRSEPLSFTRSRPPHHLHVTSLACRFHSYRLLFYLRRVASSPPAAVMSSVSGVFAGGAASASLADLPRVPRGIMLTNDDGPPGPCAPFMLPFTRALRRVLLEVSSKASDAHGGGGSGTRVFACTPAAQQSWTGKQLTRWGRLRARTNWRDTADALSIESTALASRSEEVSLWASVEGSPACATRVGLGVLQPFGPDGIDLVISGPNLGRNTGRTFMLASGTIGAAVEAALVGNGVRAVALSFGYKRNLTDHTPADIDTACDLAARVILRLFAHWPSGSGGAVDLFSVNVPLALADGRDTRVLMAHAVHEDVGSLYRRVPTEEDASQQCTVPVSSSSVAVACPSEVSSPHAARLSDTSIASLVHSVEVEFHVDFQRAPTEAPNWHGSDLWAVQRGLVAVTPLSAALHECAHAHPHLADIAKLFPPEPLGDCARAAAAAAAAGDESTSTTTSASSVSNSNSALAAPAAAAVTHAPQTHFAAAVLEVLAAQQQAASGAAAPSNQPPSSKPSTASSFILSANALRLLARLPRRMAERDEEATVDDTAAATEQAALPTTVVHEITCGLRGLTTLATDDARLTRVARDAALVLQKLVRALGMLAEATSRSVIYSTDVALCASRDRDASIVLVKGVSSVGEEEEDEALPLADLLLGVDPSTTTPEALQFLANRAHLSAALETLGIAPATATTATETDAKSVEAASSIVFRGSRAFHLLTPSALDPNSMQTGALATNVSARIKAAAAAASTAIVTSPSTSIAASYSAFFKDALEETVTAQVARRRLYYPDFDHCEMVGPTNYLVFDLLRLRMDEVLGGGGVALSSSRVLDLRCDLAFASSHPTLFEGLVYDARTGRPVLAAQIVPDEEDDYGAVCMLVTTYFGRTDAVATLRQTNDTDTTASPSAELPLVRRLRRALQMLGTGTDAREASFDE